MKTIFFTIAMVAVCYVTNVNASNISTDVQDSFTTQILAKGQSITKHPDFTDAELRAVLKDIAFQLDASFEDIVSQYNRGLIILSRPEPNVYQATVLDADGGLNIDLIGDIL